MPHAVTALTLVLAMLAAAAPSFAAEPMREVDPVRVAEEEFSAALLSALTANAEGAAADNVIVSPLGLFDALALLRLGAAGDSLSTLEKLLGTRGNVEDLARGIRDLRAAGNPFVYQLDVPISDNNGRGVKLMATPAADSPLAESGLVEGDLIFTVDGEAVLKATDVRRLCAGSAGEVTLSGITGATGQPFSDRTARLVRVRQFGTPPSRQQVCLATALWLDDRQIASARDFSQRAELLFAAPTTRTDFSRLPALETEVSQYFSHATEGRVAAVQLPKMSPNAAMLLVNVVAMQAQWQRRFPPARAGAFAAPGGGVSAELMRQTAFFRMTESADLQVLELPYRDSSLVMWILLPRQTDGWKTLDVKGLLAPAMLANIRRSLKAGPVDVTLPRFRISRELPLRETLTAQGAGDLFTEKADFSQIDPSNKLMLTDVVQQAFIEVNEQGTRAGAVTQVVGAVKSAEDDVRTFQATHPFLFLIRDSQGGVFYAGRVLSPTAPPPAKVDDSNTR